MNYVIKNSNNYSKQQIANFYNMIPLYKKNKINKYIHYETKKNSIIGEMILYELLLSHNISYNNLDFYINSYGKPYIKNNKIYFNISHSFNYVVTAISNNEIGIDIEKIRTTPLNVINQFATENEKKYILSSNNNIEERIFKIYTLKEAYFKMRGETLNNILNIEFKINDNKVYCSDCSVKARLITDIEGYVIAYCEKI